MFLKHCYSTIVCTIVFVLTVCIILYVYFYMQKHAHTKFFCKAYSELCVWFTCSNYVWLHATYAHTVGSLKLTVQKSRITRIWICAHTELWPSSCQLLASVNIQSTVQSYTDVTVNHTASHQYTQDYWWINYWI